LPRPSCLNCRRLNTISTFPRHFWRVVIGHSGAIRYAHGLNNVQAVAPHAAGSQFLDMMISKALHRFQGS
jgi:hypothetical protein